MIDTPKTTMPRGNAGPVDLQFNPRGLAVSLDPKFNHLLPPRGDGGPVDPLFRQLHSPDLYRQVIDGVFPPGRRDWRALSFDEAKARLLRELFGEKR
jgi:hypothetical protein